MCGIVVVICAERLEGWGKWYFVVVFGFPRSTLCPGKKDELQLKKSVNATKRHGSCGGVYFWPNISKSFMPQAFRFQPFQLFEVSEASYPKSTTLVHPHSTMLLPRLQPPLRVAVSSIGRSAAAGSQQTCLNEAFAQLAIKGPAKVGGLGGVRYASHKAQGAVNKAKDGPGKRLGAKKSGGMHTFPTFPYSKQ